MSMADYPRTQLYTRHNIQHRKERNPIESYLNCKMKGIGPVMCPHIFLVVLFLLPFRDETERININFPQFRLVFHERNVEREKMVHLFRHPH